MGGRGDKEEIKREEERERGCWSDMAAMACVRMDGGSE